MTVSAELPQGILPAEILAGIETLRAQAASNPALREALTAALGNFKVADTPAPETGPVAVAVALPAAPVSAPPASSGVGSALGRPPPVATGHDAEIAAAGGFGDLIEASLRDPRLAAALRQTFGGEMATAQKSPYAWLLGAAVGAIGSHYGFAAPPDITALIGLVLAVLAGDAWQWASAAVSRAFPRH